MRPHARPRRRRARRPHGEAARPAASATAPRPGAGSPAAVRPPNPGRRAENAAVPPRTRPCAPRDAAAPGTPCPSRPRCGACWSRSTPPRPPAAARWSRARYMGAAAQLDRVVTRFDHAHDLAVFFAEEGDRPGLLGLFARRLRRRYGLVAQYLCVDEVLHAPDLLIGHRPEMAEVEPQPVGSHQRALLAHVVAEHLAQRPVQQMGPGVVAPYGVAALAGRSPPSLPGRPRRSPRRDSRGEREPLHHRRRVQDADTAGDRRDRTGVAHLTAALGVEGSPVEEDLDQIGGVGACSPSMLANERSTELEGRRGRAPPPRSPRSRGTGSDRTRTVSRSRRRRPPLPPRPPRHPRPASRARSRWPFIASSKPGRSTAIPRSRAISSVSSMLKP